MGAGDDPKRASRCRESGVISSALRPLIFRFIEIHLLDVSKSPTMSSEPSDRGISRRRLLGGAAIAAPAALGLGGLLSSNGASAETPAPAAAGGHAGHGDFPHATFAKGGSVDHDANGFHPTRLLRDFDYGKTRRLASGRVVREWEIFAQDKEI